MFCIPNIKNQKCKHSIHQDIYIYNYMVCWLALTAISSPTLLGSQNAASGSSTTIVLVAILSSSGLDCKPQRPIGSKHVFACSNVPGLCLRGVSSTKNRYMKVVWVGKDLCKLYIFWFWDLQSNVMGKSISPNLGIYRGLDRTRYARWYCSWFQGWAKGGGWRFLSHKKLMVQNSHSQAPGFF